MSELPACVRLTHPAENYPVLEIDHASCRAKVALHGAHVMEWTPAGHDPVLYLSPKTGLKEGKAIRGGIPVCWPWFGPHPTDSSKPAHGFARARFWKLVDCQDEGASVELRFTLKSDEHTRALWPHEFEAIVEIRLGAELHVSLTSHNTGTGPFVETAALHTYLTISHVDAIEIAGLGGSTFLEKAGGLNVPGDQAGPVRIVGEVDRVYASTADTVLTDDDKRTIHIHKHGSGSTVVWNPGPEKAASLGDLPAGDYPHFVCIEAANTPGAEVTVPPGGHHVLRTRITVARS
ncbi:D-hexose-6-phosphate mutarotase [Luteolibacter ambystomatis]|uniref:Putative glucose-6-phosphate 1-epimerase n=1 Tax=Luteolibacter ambystomatis TaxID=2824561 RepID=A0A975IYR7_9BACT|nr:D-hexose-6-phosphate mutarotase [Luteolibacter ambystomatis]QUE50507.1 D-hexose-6-phosphate mutarotase [Luteolibacter ambystomatis]